MKLCHGTKSLIPRGRSRRKGRAEYLFTCRVCGGKWQWTKDSGYYQVKAKSLMETKSVSVRIRATPTRDREIKTGWGGWQRYADLGPGNKDSA